MYCIVYLNTCSWDQMVYKVVGGASGIFNDIAVLCSAYSSKPQSVTAVVSTPSKASRQFPLEREKVYGLFLDRLANSLMDGIHVHCSLACRDIVSAWAVAACLLMACV